MRSGIHDIQSFRPAEYKPGKDSHIRFYSFNPDTEKLERKKIRLNHIPEKIREKYAMKLVDDLNAKLFSGWNPFTKVGEKNKTLLEATKEFLLIKEKELRPNTMRSYTSYIKHLTDWIKRNGHDKILVKAFDRGMAIDLMNEVFRIRKTRTFNNYITCYRAFWNWMIEYQYCNSNPFREVSKKKAGEKERTIIDKDTREQIKDYLEKNDPPFLFVCYLVFYCLIRPNEITHLKATHFKFKGSSIYIPSHASKNGKGDRVTIPDVIALDLERFIISCQASATEYIFSDIGSLSPGKKRLDPREFTRRWSKLRELLEFPKEYQLYSLKDSGIVQMLEDGVSPDEVMHQARHEDLATTTHYLRYVTYGASDQVRRKVKGF